MTDDPGRVLHRLILAADPGWQDQFSRSGEKALGHHALSQLVLLLGDSEPVFIDAQVEYGASRSAFLVRVFTHDALIVTATVPDDGVTSRVIPRKLLRRLEVLSAPIVTIGNLGRGDSPIQVRLEYVDLPPFEFPAKLRDDRAEDVAQFLPSLLADLQAFGR